jgi:hypothetical protein
MIRAPFAQMPKDLQAVAVVGAGSVRRPENAYYERGHALLLARATVALKVAAQILEEMGITHFNSHAFQISEACERGKIPL